MTPTEASVPAIARELAQSIADAGGRLLVVGGWVRDALRGVPSKDLDLEVFGLDAAAVQSIVAPHGFTPPVGRQFSVWRHTREGLDIGLPRGGFDPGDNLAAAFARAARARDLTVNAMGFDPLDGAVLDPLGGRRDLADRRLRAADDSTFGEDPLRVLRLARLAALLEATPNDALTTLCHALDLTVLPPERLAQELERILLTLPAPWRAIEWLDRLGQLEVFPPIAALRDVPQDPEWHPEGDVFVHTGMVVDRAATLARELALEAEDQAILLWSALCHDLGKPDSTVIGDDERVRSPGHDRLSAEIARVWLGSLRLGTRRIDAIDVLVHHHLAPALFVGNGAKASGYRRLARKLAAGGMTPVDLERVARADHLGRTTPMALAGRFDEGNLFLTRAREAFVEHGPRTDVVRAATFMKRGIEAGPELGRLLTRAREIQDDTGETDEDAIAGQVMAERTPSGEA